jgi:hypothetical protein
MDIYKNNSASIRIWANNPNHHLYNNNGVWWIHYTAHNPDHTSKRIRKSLRTRNVETAREQRDGFLFDLFKKEVAK